MKLLLVACGWRRRAAWGCGRCPAGGRGRGSGERVRRTPGTARHHARPAPSRIRACTAQIRGRPTHRLTACLVRESPRAAGPVRPPRGRAGRPAGGASSAQVGPRVGVVDHQVGRLARRRGPAGRASRGPPRTPPAERGVRRAGRPARAGPAPRGRPGRAAALPRRRCRRRSARPPRGPSAAWRRRGRAGRACGRRSAGNFAPPCSAYVGKLSICTRVGTSAVPRPGHLGDDVVGQAGAVLDAVDAGGDELGDRLLAEAVRGDPGAELVGAARSPRPRRPRASTASGRRRRGRSSRRPA